MPVDPATVIGEILGEPAAQMRNPVNAEYRCPYTTETCIKHFHSNNDSAPVCSIWRWKGKVVDGRPANSDLVCVCPKRFYEINLLEDVIKHCWKGPPPRNPALVREIKMGKTKDTIGNVDCVIADLTDDGKVKEFISVELQAVDITGSYHLAYEANSNSKTLDKRPSYGFNLANVYKRFVTQLIAKGYYHHHWKTKIVAVVQDVVFDDIYNRGAFQIAADPRESNIVFMVYKYASDSANPGRFVFELDRVVGTHHTNLQNAVLYREPPSRQEFCQKIQSKL